MADDSGNTPVLMQALAFVDKAKVTYTSNIHVYQKCLPSTDSLRIGPPSTRTCSMSSWTQRRNTAVQCLMLPASQRGLNSIGNSTKLNSSRRWRQSLETNLTCSRNGDPSFSPTRQPYRAKTKSINLSVIHSRIGLSFSSNRWGYFWSTSHRKPEFIVLLRIYTIFLAKISSKPTDASSTFVECVNSPIP